MRHRRSTWRAAASRPSAATRTTRSAAATSAPRRWRSRTCTRTPTACAGRCGAAGADWEEIAWDEALDEAAERLAAIQKAHGRERGGASTRATPPSTTTAPLLFGQVFLRSLGTRSRFSATSVDQLPHMLASLLMFGHQLLLPVPDVDRTRLLPGARRQPARLQRQPDDRARASSAGSRSCARAAAGWSWSTRGARRRRPWPTATCPSGPAPTRCCCSPCCTSLFAEGLVRPGRLAGFADGLDAGRARWPRRSRPKRWPTRPACRRTRSRELAREFAAAPSRRWPTGASASRTQEFGGLALAGSSTCSTSSPATSTARAARCSRGRRWTWWRWPRASASAATSTRAAAACAACPSSAASCPVAVLAEEIETPGAGPDPRAGDLGRATPCCRRPTARRLERALAGLEFMVSIDIYLNETTRHAHLILPPTGRAGARPLRRRLPPAGRAQHREVLARAVRRAAADARHDWQILLELARRLDARQGRRGLEAAADARRCCGRLGPRGLRRRCCCAPGPYGPPAAALRRGLSLAPPRQARRTASTSGPLRAVPAGAALHAAAAASRWRPSASSPTWSGCGAGWPGRERRCCSSAAATCARTTRGCTTASGW